MHRLGETGLGSYCRSAGVILRRNPRLRARLRILTWAIVQWWVRYTTLVGIGPEAPLGFQVYSPHTFNNLYSLTWRDNFINNLGFLNLPVSSLVVLPPFDIVRYFVRLCWDRQNMIFQPNRLIPHRLIGGLTFGTTYMVMSPSFVYLADPEQRDPVIDGQMFIENDSIFHAGITFFHGERLASQNSLRWGSSVIGYDFSSPDIERAPQLHGNLSLFEYSGSLRYNLTTGSFMIFVKGGYDLSWYRFGRLSSYGKPLSYPDAPRVSYSILRHPLEVPTQCMAFRGRDRVDVPWKFKIFIVWCGYWHPRRGTHL